MWTAGADVKNYPYFYKSNFSAQMENVPRPQFLW